MTWTPERIDELKRLWTEGHSCTQIAVKLRGVSRNAVIGKVHRLGLAGRLTAARPVKRRPQINPKVIAAAIPGGPKMRSAPLPLDLPAPQEAKRLTIAELKAGVCKYPLGDPKEAGFGFCGCKCAEEESFCQFHKRIVYQKPVKRERRRGAYAPAQSKVLDLDWMDAA